MKSLSLGKKLSVMRKGGRVADAEGRVPISSKRELRDSTG